VSFLNHVAEFVRVIASSVRGANGATLYDVAGIAGFDAADEGEQAHEQEVYQSLGVIGRPLAPEADLFAEAIAMRTEDGLLPIAFRDLRLHRAVNPSGGATTPREGQLMFAGYGGAFLSHSMTADPTGSKRGNITTLYVPYDFDGEGVPQKAHAIIINPSSGDSSISLVHGDGVFFTLSESTGVGSGPGIIASVGGSTFLRMTDGELTLQAERVLLKGNVYLGRAAEAGVQLLGGPVSPASGSVFVSTL
jgi:hypothetical protein